MKGLIGGKYADLVHEVRACDSAGSLRLHLPRDNDACRDSFRPFAEDVTQRPTPSIACFLSNTFGSDDRLSVPWIGTVATGSRYSRGSREPEKSDLLD
jgi:hypothetical protein